MKASLVRHESRLVDAISQAFACTLRSPMRALLGWLPYATLLLLAVLAASKLTELCDVSRSGAWRIGAVFVVQQLVVVLSVRLRAAWFARALWLAAAAAEQAAHRDCAIGLEDARHHALSVESRARARLVLKKY